MADINDLKNMKDHTNEFDPTDIQNNKAMGILSYIGLLVLIPIFAAKDSKFARFHANQGLVLVIAQAIVTTVHPLHRMAARPSHTVGHPRRLHSLYHRHNQRCTRSGERAPDHRRNKNSEIIVYRIPAPVSPEPDFSAFS